ncbi:DUF6082 family protein [Streptomyces cyaneofuscatus]|uniref:DUF6082 family protein n=1 Tax=Streptomyces cyaneofuscatus TaxID=66883 RepID=UPI00341CFB4D
MQTNRFAAAGLVLGTSFGATHRALTVKHHRDKTYLAFTRMHADLLRDPAADPRLNDAMLRLGFLPRAGLRQVVAEFMGGSVGRKFWKLARNHRRITARDKHDSRFNDLMEEAYAEAPTEPAAA